MKLLKKCFISLFLLFVFSVGTIIVVGTKYKEQIVDFVKVELGKQLTREVKVGTIEYSLFSNFPNVSVDLINLQTHSFKNGDQPFLKLKKVHLVFDIIPLISGVFDISEIILEEGEVNIIHNKLGNPNYNILEPKQNNNSSGTSLSIEDVKLQNVVVSYADWKNGDEYKLELEGCVITPAYFVDSVSASFDLEGQILLIQTDGYKSKNILDVNGAFLLWIKNGTVKFDYQGLIGSGNMKLFGEIIPGEKSDKWNISCDLRNHKAKKLLSSFPSDFQNTFLKDLKGNLSANILIEGQKNKEISPSLKIEFDFNNGSFIVDDNLFSDILLRGMCKQPKVNSVGGASVRLNAYSTKYNGILIVGDAEVKDFKRPLISATIRSEFDLSNLHKLALMDDFENLSGNGLLDMSLSGRLKEVFVNRNKKALGNFKSNGTLTVKSVVAQPSDFDYPILIKKGELSFDNKNLLLESFSGSILSSSFEMNGEIKNYLKTVFGQAPLAFYADLKMDKMVLEEFIGDNSDSTFQPSKKSYQFNLPQSISLNTHLELGEFSFRKFNASDIKGLVVLENQQLSFKGIEMKTCNGNAELNGSIHTKQSDQVVYTCQSRFENIDAQQAFYQFENFGQDVLLRKHVKGRITLSSLLIAVSDKQLNLDQNKIYTETKLKIKDGELIHFEPLVELQIFLKEDLKLNFNLSHLKFETLENDIEINHGVINIPEMAIRSKDLNLDIEGTHTFNQDIDYLLKIKHSEIFKANKKNAIDQEFGIIENNDKTATLPLRMQGNMDDPKFSYDSKEKVKGVKQALKNEGKEIAKVFMEEFGKVFNRKKNKSDSTENKIKEDLNNGSVKTKTTLIWDEEENDDEE